MNGNSIVFVASDTSSHFNDLKLSLELNPSKIFIEKGFSNEEEYAAAKQFNIPFYILSQYRYSKIFQAININNIESINHSWEIDKSSKKEWLYHLISIDNFLKNKDTIFFTNTYEKFRIDYISQGSIKTTATRNLKTTIKTKSSTIELQFGIDNKVLIDNKIHLECFKEDCLEEQLKCILLYNNTSKLQKV